MPVLFGAFLIYLWEVAVLASSVPSVLMPAQSTAPQRGWSQSLPLL